MRNLRAKGKGLGEPVLRDERGWSWRKLPWKEEAQDAWLFNLVDRLLLLPQRQNEFDQGKWEPSLRESFRRLISCVYTAGYYSLAPAERKVAAEGEVGGAAGQLMIEG